MPATVLADLANFGHAAEMAESHFDEWIAQRYHLLWPELFEPSIVQPAVEVLADLAGTGSALEFGIGTGRIAIPLSQRGVPVQGVELSAAMVAQLCAQHDTAHIDVTIGDFATTKVDGSFSLVYLLRNTITNLITQDEQVQAFRNARHTWSLADCLLLRTTFQSSDACPLARRFMSLSRRRPVSASRTTTPRIRLLCPTTTG